MPVHNSEIAELFEELGDLLEIEGANPFRVRAYRNAARTISGQSRSMRDLIHQGVDLSEYPDIGDDLAEKIRTIVETGKFPLLEEVRERIPSELSDLMKVKGLGPKRVKALYHELGIRSAEDLKRVASSGRIADLEGFGEKTQSMILRRLEEKAQAEKRTPLFRAEEIAEPFLGYLQEVDGVNQVTIAGSYRRRKETVGDLDILVTARKGSSVMERFVGYDEVQEIVSQGETRSTVRLRSGMQVDLRLLPEVSYGAALQYFTGSREHNIAVRRIAVDKGLKMNEYGVFRGDDRVAGKTEKEVYDTVGLPWFEPELRENRGEIEAALEDELPELVTLDDIRGDLHSHTNATDGRQSLEEMARAAAERGYEYLAITDHSQHVAMANGLDPDRLREQIEAIDALNEELDDITLLKGIEVDILEDGSLDLPDDVLERLDLRVCSIHYQFDLSQEKQTRRILKAMDNPLFNILGHPTGRLIGRREPYPLDMEAILQAAADRGCIVELNANPNRLDLTDDACLLARELGVKISIATDAHRADNFPFMRYGINQARRGWMRKEDVINTLSLNDLRPILDRG